MNFDINPVGDDKYVFVFKIPFATFYQVPF